MIRVIVVAGARPNFIKIAPLIGALKKTGRFAITLVHTGQHYDEKLSRVFFEELKIPKPDIDLEIGSDSQAGQTAKIMMAFDALLPRLQPNLVIVVGDVNSTLACALTAAKRNIKIAHVEAGLRSLDWTMPEEINRVLTDRLSDFLFCTEPSAVRNLKREGTAANKIFFVGNVMIDTLLKQRKLAEKSNILQSLNLNGKSYGVITLHRPSNVDERKNLQKFIKIFQKLSLKLPLVFPVHPRTKKNMRAWRISSKKLILTEPLGYLDFLKLMSHSRVMLTDSGGIQEETTILGVPCLTLRENTERPVTVTHGTNQIVGLDEKCIFTAVEKILNKPLVFKRIPKYWDGKAATRIVNILNAKFKN